MFEGLNYRTVKQACRAINFFHPYFYLKTEKHVIKPFIQNKQ